VPEIPKKHVYDSGRKSLLGTGRTRPQDLVVCSVIGLSLAVILDTPE